MPSDQFAIDRRSFIKAAAPFVLAAPAVIRGQVLIERGRFGPDDVPLARQQLLEMVNAERRQHGLPHLELDDLACRVAADHALDMIEGQFLSHWGRDGRKPYQRYSFAGGTDAIQENASSADNVSSITPAGVEQSLFEMHQSMIDEVPPNDGHLRTILFPYHTHVGFGIAAKPDRIRLDEIYVSRYAEVAPVERVARPATRIRFKGKLLDRKHWVQAIYVYHEPLPVPPPIEWLRIPRSYGLPDTFASLLPRLPSDYLYVDGSQGVIETGDKGTFRTRVRLFKEPGINTIVLWIKRANNEAAFPVTQVCIRCE